MRGARVGEPPYAWPRGTHGMAGTLAVWMYSLIRLLRVPLRMKQDNVNPICHFCLFVSQLLLLNDIFNVIILKGSTDCCKLYQGSSFSKLNMQMC